MLQLNHMAYKKHAYRIKVQRFWVTSVRNQWSQATNLKWKKSTSVVFKWFI
jgi:hypothetical protein